MQWGYRQKSRFWSNSWLWKIAGRAKCQKHLQTTKLSIWHSGHAPLAIDRLLDVPTTKWPTMQCRSHSRRRTMECLFVTACSMDEYAEEKRTEKNLIVRSGISEAETTNNKCVSKTHISPYAQLIPGGVVHGPLKGTKHICNQCFYTGYFWRWSAHVSPRYRLQMTELRKKNCTSYVLARV